LQKHFPQDAPVRPPLFRSGAIISSGALVKSANLARQWQETARQASAVEMELAGVWHAARYANQGTHVLAIRGLSDIIGYKRDPAWTEFAAYSAAAFMHALLTSGIIRRDN
jgi:nucleoside phosphorylase